MLLINISQQDIPDCTESLFILIILKYLVLKCGKICQNFKHIGTNKKSPLQKKYLK